MINIKFVRSSSQKKKLKLSIEYYYLNDELLLTTLFNVPSESRPYLCIRMCGLNRTTDGNNQKKSWRYNATADV